MMAAIFELYKISLHCDYGWVCTIKLRSLHCFFLYWISDYEGWEQERNKVIKFLSVSLFRCFLW